MTVVTDTTPSVDERLDHLTAGVEYLVAQAEQDRLRRQGLEELNADLMPIARQAMASAGDRIDAAGVTIEDLGRLLDGLAAALPALQTGLEQLTALTELSGDVAHLAGPVMESVTDRLAALDRRGYFEFARSGAGIVDRIVSTYGQDDVEALGENIVLILDTVKEMTQPEVMTMLRRTFHTVGDPEVTGEPPSMFALVRQMRDPDVRRGLARLLTLLRSMGIDEPRQTSREGD